MSRFDTYLIGLGIGLLLGFVLGTIATLRELKRQSEED